MHRIMKMTFSQTRSASVVTASVISQKIVSTSAFGTNDLDNSHAEQYNNDNAGEVLDKVKESARMCTFLSYVISKIVTGRQIYNWQIVTGRQI